MTGFVDAFKERQKTMPQKKRAAQSTPILYKIIIQKQVAGKGKPTDIDRQRNRRVIVVDAAMIAGTPADIKDRLKTFGAFDGPMMTDEIISIMPAERPFVVIAS